MREEYRFWERKRDPPENKEKKKEEKKELWPQKKWQVIKE